MDQSQAKAAFVERRFYGRVPNKPRLVLARPIGTDCDELLELWSTPGETSQRHQQAVNTKVFDECDAFLALAAFHPPMSLARHLLLSYRLAFIEFLKASSGLRPVTMTLKLPKGTASKNRLPVSHLEVLGRLNVIPRSHLTPVYGKRAELIGALSRLGAFALDELGISHVVLSRIVRDPPNPQAGLERSSGISFALGVASTRTGELEHLVLLKVASSEFHLSLSQLYRTLFGHAVVRCREKQLPRYRQVRE